MRLLDQHTALSESARCPAKNLLSSDVGELLLFQVQRALDDLVLLGVDPETKRDPSPVLFGERLPAHSTHANRMHARRCGYKKNRKCSYGYLDGARTCGYKKSTPQHGVNRKETK